MKNAIGYIRVSTEQQADKYGVEAQREAILDYAHTHNYAIVSWKEDHISGVKDDRPAFNEILFQDQPDIDAVIVFKNDRIAREVKLYFYFYYALEKKGLKLISTQEEFGEYGDFAPVIQSIVSYVAAMERKNITLRTTMGRERKAATGGYTGGKAPFGYLVRDRELVPDPQEAPIVQKIFELRSLGKGLSEIAHTLNATHCHNRKGNDFLPQNIRSILMNKQLYEGYARYNSGWIPGVHAPILEVDPLD